MIITQTGTITEYALTTPNAQPRGIVAGPEGNLWFAEAGGNKIARMVP
jgi:virginiamycin B lyase